MSFIKDKILKFPDMSSYTLREKEISHDGFNFGFNLCFLLYLILIAIVSLLFVLKTVPVHATELVGGDTPIETDCSYVICTSDTAFYKYLTIYNYEVRSDGLYGSYSLGNSLDDVADVLRSGDFSRLLTGCFAYPYDTYTLLYCSDDVDWCGQSFQKTPFLVHTETTVGGLQAPEIAEALTAQVLGLVPLVIGLVVLALGLWKGLGHIWSILARA